MLAATINPCLSVYIRLNSGILQYTTYHTTYVHVLIFVKCCTREEFAVDIECMPGCDTTVTLPTLANMQQSASSKDALMWKGGKKVKTAKMAKGRQTVSGRVQGLCYRLLNVTVTFYYSGTCNQNIFTNLSLCFCLFSLSQRCRQKLTKVYHERHHAVAVMVSVINSSSLDSSAACQFQRFIIYSCSFSLPSASGRPILDFALIKTCSLEISNQSNGIRLLVTMPK